MASHGGHRHRASRCGLGSALPHWPVTCGVSSRSWRCCSTRPSCPGWPWCVQRCWLPAAPPSVGLSAGPCNSRGSAALAVCAWWLVPFLGRLGPSGALGGSALRRCLALREAPGRRQFWPGWEQPRPGRPAADTGPSRRLATRCLGGASRWQLCWPTCSATLRPERWLELSHPGSREWPPPGLVARTPAVRVRCGRCGPLGLCSALPSCIVFVVITLRLEVLPLAVWLLWGSRRTWAWSSAWPGPPSCCWFRSGVRSATRRQPKPTSPITPLEAAAAASGPGGSRAGLHRRPSTTPRRVTWAFASGATLGDTTMRPVDASAPCSACTGRPARIAEFLEAENLLAVRLFRGVQRKPRRHWFDAWQDAGSLSNGQPRPELRPWAPAGTPNAMPTATCRSQNSPL